MINVDYVDESSTIEIFPFCQSSTEKFLVVESRIFLEFVLGEYLKFGILHNG